MRTRWIVAPLVALLCATSSYAQQTNALPPIVSGSTAKIQQSTSFAPMPNSSYTAPNGPANVYTPVAPLTTSPAPMPGSGSWADTSSGGSCATGCGVQGCEDCATDCGSCDRYFASYGGWNGLLDYNGTIQQLGSEVNASFDDGYGGGVAVGRYFTPRLRSELDFAYRHNDGDTWTASGGQTTLNTLAQPLNGDIDCYSGMMNVLCDFGGRRLGRITPYAGAGAGVAFVEGDFQAAGFQFALDDSAFAYQGIAGLLFPMGERADWFCEYRYFGTDTLVVHNVTDNSVSDYDYRAHNIFFGIRFCR